MIKAVEETAGICAVTGYTKEVELKMRRLFATLSENGTTAPHHWESDSGKLFFARSLRV
jgi:hypothetical protein